jgi:hypothetical protein
VALQLGYCAYAASDFRNQSQVPPSWTKFSTHLRSELEVWVAAETAEAKQFRTWGKDNKGKANGPPESLVLRIWVNPDGSVAKASFPPLPDAAADRDLHAILQSGVLKEIPPPDMPQPVVLRLRLLFTR